MTSKVVLREGPEENSQKEKCIILTVQNRVVFSMANFVHFLVLITSSTCGVTKL